MDLPRRPKSSSGNLQPPPPLNRYRVLPSIEGRRPEAPEDAAPEEAERGGDALLLAVRAPCGRRFEERFAAAAPLRALREDAEARYGAAYGPVSIEEAAGAPRRSFTDLERSLRECGIRDRTLLCITLLRRRRRDDAR